MDYKLLHIKQFDAAKSVRGNVFLEKITCSLILFKVTSDKH